MEEFKLRREKTQTETQYLWYGHIQLWVKSVEILSKPDWIEMQFQHYVVLWGGNLSNLHFHTCKMGRIIAFIS